MIIKNDLKWRDVDLGQLKFQYLKCFTCFLHYPRKKIVKIQQSSQRSEKEKVNVQMADGQFNEMHKVLNFKFIK